MNYNTAKKGMYLTDEGVARFENPGTVPGLPAKRWYKVRVKRVLLDSKGKVLASETKLTTVYATESTASGLGLTRLPTSLSGDGEIRTSIGYRSLGAEEDL